MFALRTLKIIRGLLTTAVVATGLLIALTDVQPVDANQTAEDQNYRMKLVHTCEINGETRYDCTRAYCTWDGSECSFWPGECFDNDGGLCW